MKRKRLRKQVQIYDSTETVYSPETFNQLTDETLDLNSTAYSHKTFATLTDESLDVPTLLDRLHALTMNPADAEYFLRHTNARFAYDAYHAVATQLQN